MIQDRLRAFMVEELNWPGSPNELTDDYPLLAKQVIDSLGMFEIVSFIESEFSVEIDNDELVPENFQTIGDIARFVETKRPG